jgi:Prenyltransferase and squalene oxidase repeat
MSIGALVSRQNQDGGWSYLHGKSWTEPTVYAVMALLAAEEEQASKRGLRWLSTAQRRDGGWPPQTGVDQSTWVTGLVALLPPEIVGPERHAGAIQWLMGTSGQETSFEYRLREWLLGNSPPDETEFEGWPWVPGAAAWVGPTSIGILALMKESHRRSSGAIADRVESGRRFLLRRMCQNGGWNHGSARPLGYEGEAYPETTGLALTALRGVRSPKVEKAVAVARGFLAECRSADAHNWLRLGLLAHNELPPDYCPRQELTCRTTSEVAVDLLLSVPGGQNSLWGAA